ncbi:hypothetical protein NC651_008457 [Populus alba x Populus x berolinensis]|nr:hypothetical protein NC651_008457 [Populus alba x Populus x berolinensis]
MHLGATVVPCTTPHVYSVQRFAKIRAEWLVSRDSRAGAREEEDEKDKRIGGARARAGDVSGREGGWYETVGFGRGDGSTTQVYNVLFGALDHDYSFLHPLARGKPRNLIRGTIITKPGQTAS